MTSFLVARHDKKTVVINILQSHYLGVLVLIDLFQESVRSLTAVRSSVLTAGDSADSGSSHCAQDTQVFETVEMLLLFCGPTLPAAVREEIEMGVARGAWVSAVWTRV